MGRSITNPETAGAGFGDADRFDCECSANEARECWCARVVGIVLADSFYFGFYKPMDVDTSNDTTDRVLWTAATTESFVLSTFATIMARLSNLDWTLSALYSNSSGTDGPFPCRATP